MNLAYFIYILSGGLGGSMSHARVCESIVARTMVQLALGSTELGVCLL